MSKGNPFVALRLARDQQNALRAKADESGATLSDLVRHAIVHYLADVPPQLPARLGGVKRSRRASRPVRLQRAIDELEDLLADYANWQANQPESLQETPTADLSAETVDTLQQALDLLNAITAPRGFGRD